MCMHWFEIPPKTRHSSHKRFRYLWIQPSTSPALRQPHKPYAYRIIILLVLQCSRFSMRNLFALVEKDKHYKS